MAIAPLIAERGRLEATAELLAATEPWPAAPFLVSLAGRMRERVGARLFDEQRAEAAARGRATDLEAAKALARAELAGPA